MNNPLLTGLVTGPNLLSYIEMLSPQDHNDIADCNSIATRSADLGHNRYTDSKSWFEEYVRTLNFLGWALYDDTILTRTRHFVTGSVADFLVQGAQTMTDSRQANAMIDTLDALKANQPAMLSFDRETRHGETFQIIPARYDSRNNVHIAVYKLELNMDIKKHRFLFWDWEKRSAEIIQQQALFKLDRNHLNNKRALIKKKLNEHLMRRFNLRRVAP
ncbi:hypothetical protein [Pseudomonas corrugata]|nr:hypothetical protein [Pseudomonas corrugata]SDV06112.1 hypothetical protein SAMN04490183_3986 [Pseudomonas corrugata]